ncbi:60S ribosomal protein L18a-like protein [Iris pallida]|uniref:60S ribosomal protein L18a-like protein n=1 Tax=Iris pallida TaxID=29817 RepID=A0AAX6FS78_IRIPA|nr:60S ribosomal protein L18a-like protein [Iris pallida]
MNDEEKNGDHHLHHQQQQQYGTFGSAGGGGPPGAYPAPPPQHHPPAIGFPQPVPPPGAAGAYYAYGYQAAPGYAAVVEGRPIREPGSRPRLPCCGIGVGWFLFIVGFFCAAIPWYFGAFILLCVRRFDHREKPGYVACTIAAVIAAIAILIGVTNGDDDWW